MSRYARRTRYLLVEGSLVADELDELRVVHLEEHAGDLAGQLGLGSINQTMHQQR